MIIAFVIARGALSPSDIVKRESTLVMTIFHALNSVFIVYQYFFNEAVETSSTHGLYLGTSIHRHIITNHAVLSGLNAFLVDLSVSIGLFLASLYCNHIYRRTLQLANAESPVTESVAASGKDAKKGTAKKAKAVKTA